MTFTADELFEIEKAFDYQASTIQNQLSRITNSIAAISKVKAKKYCNKVFDSHMKAYDMMRTISAKCQTMRRKN